MINWGVSDFVRSQNFTQNFTLKSLVKLLLLLLLVCSRAVIAQSQDPVGILTILPLPGSKSVVIFQTGDCQELSIKGTDLASDQCPYKPSKLKNLIAADISQDGSLFVAASGNLVELVIFDGNRKRLRSLFDELPAAVAMVGFIDGCYGIHAPVSRLGNRIFSGNDMLGIIILFVRSSFIQMVGCFFQEISLEI
jgi:hypothetical protein